MICDLGPLKLTQKPRNVHPEGQYTAVCANSQVQNDAPAPIFSCDYFEDLSTLVAKVYSPSTANKKIGCVCRAT